MNRTFKRLMDVVKRAIADREIIRLHALERFHVLLTVEGNPHPFYGENDPMRPIHAFLCVLAEEHISWRSAKEKREALVKLRKFALDFS